MNAHTTFSADTAGRVHRVVEVIDRAVQEQKLVGSVVLAAPEGLAHSTPLSGMPSMTPLFDRFLRRNSNTTAPDRLSVGRHHKGVSISAKILK
jgi:hypothetical protein